MNKAGNRPQMMQGHRELRRQTLKIMQQQGTLTIQTDQIALQSIFSSPILQVADYIEQFEKYHLRASLSAINLKVQQYDKYYAKTKSHIEQTYNTLTYKSLSMIQDLLISLRLARIQMWREQSSIANGLKTHLYSRTLDPYDFNPSIFHKDLEMAYETLKNPNGSATIIAELSQKLKKHQQTKMEEMFSGKVTHPYLSQNKDRSEVNPSKMYASLMDQLKIKMERLNQSLFKKHYAIHDQIAKFMQFTTEHNLRAQKIAHSLIKKYNESLANEPSELHTTQIGFTPSIYERREEVDADDLFTSKYQSDLKPAFANKVHNVEFQSVHKLFDPQTGKETQIDIEQYENEHNEQQRFRMYQPRIGPFDSFTEQRKYNPKQFYNPRQYQKEKNRESQLRTQERQRSNKDKYKSKQKIVSRKIVKILVPPPPWMEIAQHQSTFIYFYLLGKQKEQILWDLKQKDLEKSFTLYSLQKEKVSGGFFRNAEQKAKQEAQAKKQSEVLAIQREKQLAQYQLRRKEEESYRLSRLHNLIESRSYQKFLTISKMQNHTPAYCNPYKVSRYGLTFNTAFDKSADLREVDKFFHLYFKERYYRQNESVKDNSDNPIIFLDSTKVSMDGSNKIVSQYIGSIVKRADSLPFFLVWGDDLLHFHRKGEKDKKAMEFEFYPFASTLNCRKLMYELRRRLDCTIVQKIKEQYTNLTEEQRIYSKVEVAHRAIFNRHQQMPTVSLSVTKGKQIVQQIFERLRK